MYISRNLCYDVITMEIATLTHSQENNMYAVHIKRTFFGENGYQRSSQNESLTKASEMALLVEELKNVVSMYRGPSDKIIFEKDFEVLVASTMYGGLFVTRIWIGKSNEV